LASSTDERGVVAVEEGSVDGIVVRDECSVMFPSVGFLCYEGTESMVKTEVDKVAAAMHPKIWLSELLDYRA
jgi:hypothetical protein